MPGTVTIGDTIQYGVSLVPSVSKDQNTQESWTDVGATLFSWYDYIEEFPGVLRSHGISLSADSSKISIFKVPFDEKRNLIRNEPIEIDVIKSECGQYVTIYSTDLETSLSEESVDELKDAFEAVLASIYKVFAMGNPEEMDPLALKIKEHFLATYRLEPII